MALIKCTCKSEYQDEKYGKDNRVGNKTSKDLYRCTICRTERQEKK